MLRFCILYLFIYFFNVTANIVYTNNVPNEYIIILKRKDPLLFTIIKYVATSPTENSDNSLGYAQLPSSVRYVTTSGIKITEL